MRNEKKRIYNNNIIKQIERLNNQCMTSLRNDDGWDFIFYFFILSLYLSS